MKKKLEFFTAKAYVETIELTMRMINEYPIYGSEGQKNVAEIYRQYLEKNGWECIVDEYSYTDIQKEENVRKVWEYDDFYQNYKNHKKHNVYAILDSKRPGKTFIFNGHFDVDIIDKSDLKRSYVQAKITDSNLLLGRGSTDMLSGLNSLATINNLLHGIEWSGKIIFIAVVDEELGGNGTIRACQYLKEHGYLDEIYECIIAEPSNNKKCNETMGFLPFDIYITSEVVHMNAKMESDSSEKLRCIMNAFANLKKYDSININIGQLKGGVDPSLPIDNLEVRGVCSIRNNMTLETAKSIIEECVKGAKIIFVPLQIETYKNELFPQGDLFPSACDAPIFGKYGIPTIVWGPGNLEQAHSEDEYIDLGDVYNYISDLHQYIYEQLNIK